MHLPSLPLYNQANASNAFTKPICEPFYIRRIICIGRNYAAHAKEMGHNPATEPPFFFYKPLTALNYHPNSVTLNLPHYSQNVHHELEISIAIGKQPDLSQPEDAIAGYGIALDMTCRDTQKNAKATGRPWDTAKGFDGSAPCSALYATTWQNIQQNGAFTLDKNSKCAQKGHAQDMLWDIPQLINEISRYTQLDKGDLILTGTPEGVGQVQKGDILEANLPCVNAQLKVDIQK